MVVLLNVKRLGSDEMGEKILVPDEVIDLITNEASLGIPKIFMGGEIGPQVMVEGTVDVLVRCCLVLVGRWVELLQGAVIEIVGKDVCYFFIYYFAHIIIQ